MDIDFANFDAKLYNGRSMVTIGLYTPFHVEH